MLFRLLHALCYHQRPNLPGKEADRFHQRAVAAADTLNELPVDLDVVEVKPLQQGKVAVFRAEVIHGEPHAFTPQLGEAVFHIVDAGKQAAFGDFEHHL